MKTVEKIVRKEVRDCLNGKEPKQGLYSGGFICRLSKKGYCGYQGEKATELIYYCSKS
jgi:hypothetical protein